jgi:hypothetical protein
MFSNSVWPAERPCPAPSAGIARLVLTLACAGAPAWATASDTLPPAGPASVASTARADPLDPAAPVPALVHRSSLAAYRALAADERVPWREANDRVGRIGGWRTYLREAHQPDADPGPAEHRHPTTPPASPGR